jgi:hypothetical protein
MSTILVIIKFPKGMGKSPISRLTKTIEEISKIAEESRKRIKKVLAN